MAVKITIPVDFQDSAQSYKKIIASLQSELKKVKPGTTIYENISSQLKKANSLILKLEGNIGQGVASHAEIERIIKDFSSLQTVVESVNDAYATMSIKNLNINSENFGNLAKDLVDAASQLTKAKKALSDAENLNIGELFQGDANIGKFTAKQLTSKGKSFYDSLAAQIERLGIKSNEAEQEVKTLEQSLIDLQQQADSLKDNSLAETITGIVGTAGSKASKKGQFISFQDAQNNLANITQNKFFTKTGNLKAGVSQDYVKEWLKVFGISDESIEKILETSKDRIERLRQAINAEFTNSKKNELAIQYRDAAAESIQRQAVEKQIAEVNANLKTARSTANDYSGELKGIQEQFNLLKDKLIKRGVLGATEGEAGNLQKQIDAIEQQMVSLQSAIVAQGPKTVNNLPDTPSREATDQAFDAERDAQQFKDNLKQAIAHWFSAQQIITMVKEGIRQAWTDIQGLDKAMTNIAVVTDMSVSDLWGKISDYMAIAQEYGVTTQGVYEVSQLYYQQGLSTNEVMEATTETLKMARIAGMNYAEAADAMTVAIRAFKMEMSDAQVITDVYSKVAAVTASDSEELAIAMSKTASSAESVGSSFENTTAMLAVMIETTRESAQNLGSALKSIISRYGEMKTGLTVDSEGEAIDYNKVDTALQSVGISIKDAQGQFRNFDDVIFELSKKWDSLDKNTQRYIATIMAGNRQQSRFIALVDNWERLDEVSAAAYDSEDAGLLQYAKTLDSLETKLNALSTSFQQFYMNIVNGDTFKGIIDIITNFINGLNQLGSWPAILNVGLLLKSLKTIATTFVNSFSNPLSGIVNQYKSTFSQITSSAFSEGVKAGQNHAKGFEVGISSSSAQSEITETTKRRIQGIKIGTDRKFIRKKGFELRQQQQNDPFSLTNKQAKFAKGASIIGPLLTMFGTSAANKHAGWGATISGVGNVASGIAAGAGFGPAGMAIGGIIASIASLPAIVEGFNPDKILAQKIQQAEEVLNEAEITRATKKEEARNLQSTLENLRKLQKARYSSEEAEKAFIEASNAAFEQFPQLTATFDETGNAIIDVISETSNAEQLLIEARRAAADAAEEAAAAELKLNVEKEEQAQNEYDKYYKSSRKVDTFARDIDQQNSYINFDSEAYQGKSLVEVADGYFSAIETYLANETKELQDLDYDEEYIQSEITRERDLLEGSFFSRLNTMGIFLDDDDLSLRGFNAAAAQATQRLKSATGARTASQEASINRIIDNALLSIETAPQANTDWLKIEGITDIFYGRIEEVIGNPETIFDPLTKELLPKVKDDIYAALTTYTTAWNEISGYLATNYQTEDFNELISSFKKGSITFSEFEEQYTKLFEGVKLSEEAQEEIDNVSRNLWLDNINVTRNLATTLSDKNGFKWDDYGPLFRKLKEIPQQYFANLYDFSETIDAQLEEGLINESQTKDLTSRYLQMWEGLSTAGLDRETLGQARNALASADLFSIGGIDALTSTLKDLGIKTENLPGLKDFPVYAVNFTTEYATLIERMNKGMESLRELLSNLADGLETEDAEKLAKKIGTTLSDSSAFEFIDGKWYVKNIETATAAIEKTYSGLQAQLKTTLDDSIGKLSGTVDASDEEIKQLVSINEESAKKWAAEQAAKGVTNLPDFDADGGKSLVVAYLQAEYQGITQAYETEKAWLIAETERSLAISKRARDLTGGVEKEREQEALDIIKNNGLTGYTAKDIATIEANTGLSEGAFKRNADGSFDLKESVISALPKYIQDAIYQWMDEEAESAMDAVKSLGETIASKKSNGAYAKVFKRKTEELGYKEADTYMQSLIEKAMGGNSAALDELWAEVAYEITGNQLNIDDPRVKEAIDGMFDSTKDTTAENALRFIELSTKAIENTLTNAEQTELDNLKIDSQWAKDLTATLTQEDLSIVQKNAAIITATLNAAKEHGIGWDQIEDTIQQGYTDLLKAYQAEAQGFTITDVNSLGIAESIVDEAGFYSSDSLTEFFVQAQKEGYTMDSSNFKKVFKWDEVTNSWVKIAGSKLSDLFGREVPSWMEEAFRKSENQKAVSEAIRIDDASKTVTETVGELYSNAATTSLDDLISLYETIHGEGSFAESGLLDDYQHAVTEAKKGNVKILQSFLENLVKEAQAQGINIDTTALQNTIQDAALALMATIASTVESGINGTMTNTDYTQLLKDIGVNQFEPDGSISQDWERWQNMVYSTNEGLKFTKQGLLDIYGVIASRNTMASQGILEMIAEDYREYDNLSSTLAHIKELRDLKDKADPTKRKQYEQELAVAEKIARIRSQDPDSFNFMDRAIPDEIQSPLNVWQNAADAASALQDAKKNGYMGAEDFYRIVTTASEYMTAAGQEFSVAGMTYEDLISKATSSLATANGNLVVDFSKFGIDFAGGIDDMAGGLEEGLKELAKQQIEMLDGMIAMLETMKTIQDISDTIDGSVDGKKNGLFDFTELFTVDDEGLTQWKDSTIKWWNTFQGVFGEITFNGLKIDEAWNKGLITATEVQSFMNQAKEIIANASADVNSMIDQLTAIAQTTFGEEFAIEFKANLSENLIFNTDGTVTYNNVTYNTKQEAINAALAQMQLDQDSFDKQLIENATYGGHTSNWTIKTELIADTAYEVRVSEDGQYYFQGKLLTEDQFKEAVKKVAESQKPDTAKTAGGEAATGEYLAGGAYEGIAYTIGNAIKINDSDTNYTSLEEWVLETFGNPEASTKAATKTGTWLKGGYYSGVEFDINDQIKIGNTTYNNIGEYVAGVLASVAGQVTSAAITLELGANADTEDAVSNLQKVLTKLDEIEEKKTKNIIIGARTSTAYNNLLQIKNILNSIPTSKNTTVTTTYTTVGNPPSNNNQDVDIISGAGARGNVALAKGTLMGELGPELYVQNGSYHIAGSNGPEFVDLADDAIVFNHLQTKRILDTGHSFGRGTPVTNERRAVAWATGNITGPALAGGIDSAIEQLKTAREFWKGLLNQLSLSELMAGSGGNKGGGSGNSIKAVTEELQEWYNLSRQIADIEQDINNLLAERENIEWSNGEAYLKSLREQQKLLNKQMATQQALLDYQELQLKRQAQHINQNRIWSQFLTVGEDGLLQYIEGNETNGGKGALQVLQELNQMSGEKQTAYLKRIGYSYTNNDGKTLEGQELVEQFFQELQDQIDQYDSLYDTVHETEETLENLRTEIEDINEQIKENQMDLEEAVFDIIVEAWEKQIEEMEEQADLIKEANEAYINGLNNALSAERQMYDDNQKTADREQLQRQLSLLRRSGGSASEIADLEEQLNDMLKDEYFSNQEQMIEDIQQANDIQVQQLETQIRLQEEALEYQKENGVIWTQVYEVLSKSRDEILAFMQGNSTEFFSQSLLQQEQMLTEWAHKIGIYKEDQKYQNYVNHAQNTLWNNNQAWNIGDMNKYLSTYNTLTDEEKNTIRDQFTSVYANARLDGKDHETAAVEAAAAVSQTLKRKKDANDAQNNTPSTTIPNPQNPGGGDSGGSSSSGGSSGGGSSSSSNSKVKITVSAGDGHGSPMPQTASVSPKTTFTVQPNPDSGYAFDYITYNGTKKYSTSITPTGQVASIDIKVYYKQTSNSSSQNNNNTNSSNSNSDPSGHEVANGQGTGWHFHINKDGKAVFKSAAYQTREQATAAAKSKLKEYPGHKYSTKYYMHGGLVDYTGLAMVHGSKTKPESFLNAEQTAQIREGLETTSGKSFALEGIKDTLLKLNSSIQSLTNITNKTESNTYTIAPGAVVIQVEQLNDAYDVDTLSADIMNRMYAIGNKSTNRGVSRR